MVQGRITSLPSTEVLFISGSISIDSPIAARKAEHRIKCDSLEHSKRIGMDCYKSSDQRIVYVASTN